MRIGRRLPVIALALLALLASGCSYITKASVGSSAGGTPITIGGNVTISGDGRYVAFRTVECPTCQDVVIRDLRTGTSRLLSEIVPGTRAGFGSISTDGRYLAYANSIAVPGSSSDFLLHVFELDLQTGVATDLTPDPGTNDLAWSLTPELSADGAYVAFASDRADLAAADTNGVRDVFVWSRATGSTARVSVDVTGDDAAAASDSPSISADGQRIAFRSDADDLVASDGHAGSDVFVRNLAAGTTTRVSVDPAGGDADGDSFVPFVSGDGSHVSFSSEAANLVGSDANGLRDIFVRELAGAATTRVNVDAVDSEAGGGIPTRAALDGTGRLIAFTSDRNLVPDDDGVGLDDVFVQDLQTGELTRRSSDGFGRRPNGRSLMAALSADGRYVAFSSDASNLTEPPDTDGTPDVYVAATRTPTVTSVLPGAVAPGSTVVLGVTGRSFWPDARVAVSPDAGITVTNVTFVSDTQLRVSVDVDPGAPAGARSLIVINPGSGLGPATGGTGICTGCLTVT